MSKAFSPEYDLVRDSDVKRIWDVTEIGVETKYSTEHLTSVRFGARVNSFKSWSSPSNVVN